MDGTTCFLLFDELNAFKEEIYNSFLVTIDKQIRVDIYFHHFNLDMFKKLVAEINGNYAKYIIMPHQHGRHGSHYKNITGAGCDHTGSDES